MFLDRVSQYPVARWVSCFLMLGILFLRIYIKEGYAVIAYLLGLFYLNHLMLYLSPAEDPEDLEFSMDSGFVLPEREQDEYKGFQRKI